MLWLACHPAFKVYCNASQLLKLKAKESVEDLHRVDESLLQHISRKYILHKILKK